MTTTVYVTKEQVANFEGDCEVQGMGFSFMGESNLSDGSDNDTNLLEYRIWHSK